MTYFWLAYRAHIARLTRESGKIRQLNLASNILLLVLASQFISLPPSERGPLFLSLFVLFLLPPSALRVGKNPETGPVKRWLSGNNLYCPHGVRLYFYCFGSLLGTLWYLVSVSLFILKWLTSSRERSFRRNRQERYAAEIAMTLEYIEGKDLSLRAARRRHDKPSEEGLVHLLDMAWMVLVELRLGMLPAEYRTIIDPKTNPPKQRRWEVVERADLSLSTLETPPGWSEVFWDLVGIDERKVCTLSDEERKRWYELYKPQRFPNPTPKHTKDSHL